MTPRVKQAQGPIHVRFKRILRSCMQECESVMQSEMSSTLSSARMSTHVSCCMPHSKQFKHHPQHEFVQLCA